MNIKQELTCKYCNKIYTEPITLICGDNICKQHLEELIPKTSASNKFNCPLCDEENTNHNFKINKLIEALIKRELHEFKLNPLNELTLHNLKIEINNLEKILNDPENYIYEELNELKWQVDLDREKNQRKRQIDDLAIDFIQQLESYGKRFKAEYKANVDLDNLNVFFESSKKQVAEYEKFLSLFSVDNEKREQKCKESEKLLKALQLKIKDFKQKLFSHVSIKYKQTDSNAESMFGSLVVKVIFFFLIFDIIFRDVKFLIDFSTFFGLNFR